MSKVIQLGPVDIQHSVVTVAHFQPLEANFFSSTPGTSLKNPLPEAENVLRVSRNAKCQQALENFFSWSFPDNDNFPCYNFSATPQSCQQCSRLLESYVLICSEDESLILEHSSPTRKVIESVLTGDTKVVPFHRLRFTMDRRPRFAEKSGELVLKLPLSDVRLFQSALDAMEGGLGDFETLDGRAWFWPVR